MMPSKLRQAYTFLTYILLIIIVGSMYLHRKLISDNHLEYDDNKKVVDKYT